MEEPGNSEHRIGAEHRGVEEIVVDPAIDHVHLLAALGSPHPDAAVLHVEVPALAELDAHLLGEEGMLEVGAVVEPRGEEHDGRLLEVPRGKTP